LKFLLIFALLTLAFSAATQLVAASKPPSSSSSSSSTDTPLSDPKITGPVIGIDLGTTYSVVGIYKNNKVEIIPNDQGNRITPSYVAFTADTNERLVGDAAKNQAAQNPTNTVFDVKRLMGRKFSDPDVQKDLKMLPYKVVESRNGDGKAVVQVEVKGQIKTFTPEEISASKWSLVCHTVISDFNLSVFSDTR
jgi:heat shock protein 5